MSSKLKAIIFGIDDVLYDATLQSSSARLSAVKAMIEAGLPVDVETGYRTLEEIVKTVGPDNTKHFDMLLEKLGLNWTPSVVAAGVVAYRSTSPVFLKPYPDTVPTLLTLRDQRYKLGVASEGKSVKQWQKLLSLGLQHLFDSVVTSEDLKLEHLTETVLKRELDELGAQPPNTLFVTVNLDKIDIANRAGLITVRLRKGEAKLEKPKGSQPRYEIKTLSEILQILAKL
ncbi:MAG: HAD family hydrolase [Candidatus Bathyarchaeia archaeon]|jgi:putative hydrolase of the HAD superfamily